MRSAFFLLLTGVTMTADAETLREHCGPVVRMRPCTHAPEIDGKIDDKEWSDALVMAGLTYSGANVIEPRQGSLFFTFDRHNLYFGMQTELHPEGKDVLNYIEGGADAYNGRLDGSEVWVQPPVGQDEELDPHQFWFEPGGGHFLLTHEHRFNGVKYASHIGEKVWTAESSIPWADVEYKGDATQAGTEFFIRPTRNWRYPGEWGPLYTSWGAGWGAFRSVESMIRVVCDPEAPVVQLTDLGELADGHADIKITVKSQSPGETWHDATIEVNKVEGDYVEYHRTNYQAWNYQAKKMTTPERFRKYCQDNGLTYEVDCRATGKLCLKQGESQVTDLQRSFKLPPPRARRAACYPLPRLYDVEITVVRRADDALCFRRRFNIEARRPKVWTFLPPGLINRKDDGYRGLWYYCGGVRKETEHIYDAYSGGLGTYCAKHRSFAVHATEATKTFFCYGGTTKDDRHHLIHMISCYDHRTGTVTRPTILLDPETEDGHDNVVISMDDEGHIWAFSTSHGSARRGVISRSKEPHNIDQFERVDAVVVDRDSTKPLRNFSYAQPWFVPGKGFFVFCSKYLNMPRGRHIRVPGYMTSPDGVRWTPFRYFADMAYGHYQIGYADASKAAIMFSVLPDPKTNMTRTNPHYLQSRDFGKSWETVDGRPVALPLTDMDAPSLVYDYKAEGLKTYLKDIRFDRRGHPVLLYIATPAMLAGPDQGDRTWTLARWTGKEWAFSKVTTSDQRYDMGSLYLEDDECWRIVAPTEPGPQPFNTGGEVAVWESRDQGRTWAKAKQLTTNSRYNHTYVRRPVNPHPDFYAIWADGNPREPSESRLYF